MKLQRTNVFTLAASALLALQAAVAAPVTAPADGDIFLGVRASGGQGSGVSYLAKVANDTALRSAAPGSPVSLGNYAADLEATFGSNWQTRSDLFWGFFGARNSASPSVYASRAQSPVGTPAGDFNALATNARVATKNQIISVVTAYQGLQATTGNAAAGVQTNNSSSGSYNQQIAGGTTSFGTLSQWTDIEGNFGAGAAGTALDLFRLSGTTQQGDVVNRIGTFSITNTGALSFSAAPVLNQVTLKQIQYSVQEDATSVTVTFVRSGDLTAAGTATFAVNGGTAVAGTDYTAPANLQVSFAANEAEASVVIPVANRTGYIGSRAFNVSLVSASNGFTVRAPEAATVTITDADPASTLAFAETAITLQQGLQNQAVVTVSRTGVQTGSVSVQVSASGGTLTAGTHYTFTSPATLTFLSGEASKSVTIPLTANVIPGTIQLSLGSVTGSAALGAASSATVTVQPNAGTIAFAAASQQVSSAATSVNLTLNRTGGSAGIVTVDVSATSETLVSGTHYTYTNPTTVTFAEGATTASTTVQLSNPVAGDLVLTLSNPTGFATLGTQASTTIQVTGSPGAVAFAAAEFSFNEEAGVVNIPLVRTGGTAGSVTVSVASTPGTASAADFTLSVTEATFADGSATAQFPVSLVADTVKNEPNETFTLTLGNPAGGATLGTQQTAVVRILDLDAVKPTVVVTAPKANAKLTAAAENEVRVTGTAKDNKGVAKVEVQINNGPFEEVQPNIDAKGVFNFDHPVVAVPGNNVVGVRSTDYRGNVSLLATRSFLYDDPFTPIAGIYTGLVTASGETPNTNSTEGLVSITVVAKGTFTGKLTIDSFTLAFSGSIANSGAGLFGKVPAATVDLVRKGKTPLKLALQFDLAKTGNSQRVTGTLVDGSITSSLSADRALYTNKKAPAAPFANPVPSLVTTYTVLFKAPVEAGNIPKGDGWGTATVSNAGVAKVTGTLADGSAITFSAPLSRTNELPFYVQLYKKLGSISGPVKFDDTQVQTDLTGEELLWFRPADAKSKVYPDGWPAGVLTNLIGSKFVKAAKTDTVSILEFSGAGKLTFSEGGLSASLEKGFSITAVNKVTNDAADKTFTLSVAGATGIFSGSFTPPGEKAKPAFKGVVLQKSGQVSGYFLSTATTGTPSRSGKVAITPVTVTPPATDE